MEKIKVGSEREIKFDRSLREKRNEIKQTEGLDWDVSKYDVIEHEFETGKRSVYKNFNFSIFVDDYCNADCKFCVAQLRYQHKNALYQKAHIEDRDKYLARLEEVLKMVRPLNPSVSLTGGEPTLSPIFIDILRLVDKYDFRKRTITTNGSALLKTVENDTIVNHLIQNGFNHLNISRASYDDKLNREIMRYNVEKEYCTDEMLREILSITNKSAMSHRLSCILLKESVNSVEEMKKYLDFYSTLGANNFIFRELMDYDKTAINTEKMTYCDQNKIKLYDIWHQFDDYPEFKPYLNLLGYYYYVEIYKYKGMTVASESADLNIQYREKEKHPEMVYEMVFHNNGNLCGSRIDHEDILSAYKGD